MNAGRIAIIMMVASGLTFSLIAQDKPAVVPAPVKMDSASVPGKMAVCAGMHANTCRQMAVTPDGGVIVLAGDRLLKYDASLVLQREVLLKVNAEKPSGTAENMKPPEVQEKAKAPETKTAPTKK